MKNQSVSENIDTSSLFRMPWTMSDNAFSWMEPTRYCNLRCEYCYQVHDPNSHKSLEQFEDELKGLLSLRRCDTIFLAGGEPLTHPKIIDITRLVKSYRIKPVILTNGYNLEKNLVSALKDAGLFGFTFHVDAFQNRPGWTGCTEKELNELRQRLTDMVHEEGNLICGFNTTIVPQTLHEVPDIVKWTMKNIAKVCANVLIPVRTAHKDDPWDYYAGGKKISIKDSVYTSEKKYQNLTALDIYSEILKEFPDFQFNAYLGGTVISNAPKWLFANPIGNGKKYYGGFGPKGMEFLQNMNHFINKQYLSYVKPGLYNKAKLLIFLCLIDKQTRKAFGKYIRDLILSPLMLFKKLSFQTIVVMQPQDVLPNGEQDQCDGCPNKTYWNGRLVSECRMEDYLNYGRLIQMARKDDSKTNKLAEKLVN